MQEMQATMVIHSWMETQFWEPVISFKLCGDLPELLLDH